MVVKLSTPLNFSHEKYIPPFPKWSASSVINKKLPLLKYLYFTKELPYLHGGGGNLWEMMELYF